MTCHPHHDVNLTAEGQTNVCFLWWYFLLTSEVRGTATRKAQLLELVKLE
jgi:hypothetical protein